MAVAMRFSRTAVALLASMWCMLGSTCVRALVGDFLTANYTIPKGGPVPIVTMSGWTKRYQENGEDICSSDPTNKVCKCPCDSDLISITAKYRGGKTCLYPDEMLQNPQKEGQNLNSGRSQELCGSLGLAAASEEENVCGTVRGANGVCPSLKDGYTYASAKAYCAAANMRLCSASEVLNGVIPSDLACGLNSKYVWTSSKCIHCKVDTDDMHYALYSRPSETIFGTPRCVKSTDKSFKIGSNDQIEKVYPACCADTRRDAPVWTLAKDDVKSASVAGACGFKEVAVQDWNWKDTLAFNAAGTGFKQPKKTDCTSPGVSEQIGADCRTMHGPFFGGNTIVEKTFTDLPEHTAVKLSLRVWANDIWTSDEPVTIYTGSQDDSQMKLKWSQYREGSFTCIGQAGDKWHTYNNYNGKNGYMYGPGKPAWTNEGGAACFSFVSIAFEHTENSIKVGVGAQGLVGNSENPTSPITQEIQNAVNFQYYGFDLLQIWTSNNGTLKKPLHLLQWGQSGELVTVFSEIPFLNTSQTWTYFQTEPPDILTMAVTSPGYQSDDKCNKIKARCADVLPAEKQGSSCYEMHGPFGFGTNKVSTSIYVGDLSSRSVSMEVSLRLWAADSWNQDTEIFVYFHGSDTPHWKGNPRPCGNLVPCPSIMSEKEGLLDGRDPFAEGWNIYENYTEIYHPYIANIFPGVNGTACSQCGPLYIDKTFKVNVPSTTLKLAVGSTVSQGVSNEWYGFSHLTVKKVSFGITNGCPGQRCDQACLTWPGNIDFAKIMRYCHDEEDCNQNAPSQNSWSDCKQSLSLASRNEQCVPSPYGMFSAASKTKCLLCDEDFWCARSKDGTGFSNISFADPLRSNLTDPTKKRDVTLVRIVSYGSMANDGLKNNDATVSINNNSGVITKIMSGRGIENYWQCNDCFSSSEAKFTEADIGSTYTYFNETTGAEGLNNISIVLPEDHAWCISRFDIDICARPGRAEIEKVTCLGEWKSYNNIDEVTVGDIVKKSTGSFTGSVDGKDTLRFSYMNAQGISSGYLQRPKEWQRRTHCDLTKIPPTSQALVQFSGINLGPIVEYLSYGPNGEGYTIDDPSKRCMAETVPYFRAPYTNLICKLLRGVGTDLKFRIKTNKVGTSGMSSVSISYDNPVISALQPIAVPTTGGTEVILKGNKTYLQLLSWVSSASATLSLNGKEYSATAVGSDLLFTSPELTNSTVATTGIALTLSLQIIDASVGMIGRSQSPVVYLKYEAPVCLSIQVAPLKNGYETVQITLQGKNFGASGAVGRVKLCKHNQMCSFLNRNSISSWKHEQIIMLFTNYSFSEDAFPGIIYVIVGDTQSNALRFTKAPPVLANWTKNINYKFPTDAITDALSNTGKDYSIDFVVVGPELNTNNQKANWKVIMNPYTGVSNTTLSHCIDVRSCQLIGGGWMTTTKTMPSNGSLVYNAPYTHIKVIIPPGQGINVPLIFTRLDDSDNSNMIYFGGYEPPLLVDVIYSKKIVGSQAYGEYISKADELPGLPTGGAFVTVKGRNFGTLSGSLIGKWCVERIKDCTNSPTLCCKSWATTSTARRNVSSAHTDVEIFIPPGIGSEHLLRLEVAGQLSNAVAMRYSSPIILRVENQLRNTSGADSSNESPGLITIKGKHFGYNHMGNEDVINLILMYGAPIIEVGDEECKFVRESCEWGETSLQCHLPAGQGKGLAVTVKIGGQSTTVPGLYSYAGPFITKIDPTFGLTDGSTMINVWGGNFGTEKAIVTLQFLETSAGPSRKGAGDIITTDSQKVYSTIVTKAEHSHTQLTRIHMPKGQGEKIYVQVLVDNQRSPPILLSPGNVNASHLGYPNKLLKLSGPYLPPLLLSISPTHGPASGCSVFEDLTVWKERYLTEGGGGRRCITPATVELKGLSFGTKDAKVELFDKVLQCWEVFSADKNATASLAINNNSFGKICTSGAREGINYGKEGGRDDGSFPPSFHTDTSLVLPAPIGMGTYSKIRLTIGGQVSVNTLLYSFDPPRSLQVQPIPFNALGTEPIQITAEDGLGEDRIGDLNVTIGSRECREPSWQPIHPDYGRPYLTCTPSLDVAGSKDLAIYVAQTWHYTNINKKYAFNRSVLFSVCKAGDTNLSSGAVQNYYGRPCFRNTSLKDYHHDAPCVKAEAGRGELCVKCPMGAICYVPGTPWAANKGAMYTYLDPTAKAGYFRLDRDSTDTSTESELELMEIKARVDSRRWDKQFLKKFPSLSIRQRVFDFVPCNPAKACTGGNACDPGYRYLQEQCRAYYAAHPSKVNCTTNAQCQNGRYAAAGEKLGEGYGSCALGSPPENCAVCDFTGAGNDGELGRCKCLPPARCGRCTLPAKYPNGKIVKGHFMIDGECKECPENVILIIVIAVLAAIAAAAGATYLNSKKVNLAFAAIGVDYFQVLAIFRGANIPWPDFLTNFYRFFAFFNLNIDIAAPECLYPSMGYTIKFALTEIMPLAVLGCLILDYIFRYISFRCFPTFCRREMRPNMQSYISVYLIAVNFLYLVVTRRAFEIFNCNPIAQQDDGWSYTLFSDPACPFGRCRCYEPTRPEETGHFFHKQFIVPAIISIIVYTIGFPLLVGRIILNNKQKIKVDQLLRAHDLGNDITESIPEVWSTRVKYYQLYYYFRPAKVYWLLWILYRKSAIAIIATVFYSNPAFQLALTILVLFSSYVLQVRSRPYMSETQKVKEVALFNNRLADEDEKYVEFEQIMQRLKERKKKQDKYAETRTKTKHNAAPLKPLATFGRGNSYQDMEEEEIKRFYFDYNTVELLLLGCAIVVCAAGIMFTSGHFLNRPDLEWQAITLQVTVLVTILFSLFYYGLVVIFELFDTRKWGWFNSMMKCFATRMDNVYSASYHGGLDEGDIELHSNPMMSDREAELQQKSKQIEELIAERNASKATVTNLMKEIKDQKRGKMQADQAAWKNNKTTNKKKATPMQRKRKKKIKQFEQSRLGVGEPKGKMAGDQSVVIAQPGLPFTDKF